MAKLKGIKGLALLLVVIPAIIMAGGASPASVSKISWEAWSVIVAIFSAFVAVGAAVIAWLSARATVQVSQGLLFRDLLRDYSSCEMHESLERLRREKKNRYDEDKQGLWKEMLAELRRVGEPPKSAYLNINEHRRRVAHYFTTALELYENKELISKQHLKSICGYDGIELLFEIVEHLDQAINPEYARWQYDRLLAFCPSRKRQVYGKMRPPAESE